MRRQILIGDDPRLRLKANPVGPAQLASGDTQDLIDDLLDATERLDGLGMAAPQFGANLRIVAVVQGSRTLALVNPRIVTRSTDLVRGEEGCFSFPGLFGKVTRHRSVKVDALDRNGKPVQLDATGLDAQVLQHELDHLDGVLLTDRLAEESGGRAKLAAEEVLAGQPL